MFDSAVLFLLIVASLGVGGLVGLISLIVMAIEINREGF
jgi:hypothetical protein